MSKAKPTYRELEKRLATAESIVEALKHQEVDAIVGEGQIAFLLHQKVEAAEHATATAQAQVRSIIDNTPAIVYAFDLEQRFLIANAAVAKVLNSTPEQMIGKRRHEFMPKEDADWHEANDRQVIAAGAAREFEECSQLGDRSITWLTNKFPLRDSHGRIYAVAGISVDISERKQAEATIQAAKVLAERAQAVAESASKAKDQFIAVLSHELRTPLTPALAAVAMLADDVRLPADVREDMTMVRRNIALEVRLIADLLDISRVISGKLNVEKRPVDVAQMIREAAAVVAADLDAKDQTITIETLDAPYHAFADAARLQQLFWNLLRNASKFSPPHTHILIRSKVVPVGQCPLAAQPCPVGGGECPSPTASTDPNPSCGGNLIVEVIDQGGGIPPEMLPRLFNAFEQGSQARMFGGLGLGLSICKAVVEIHGGTIAASSEGVGRGTTFTVRLPVAQCPLGKPSDPTQQWPDGQRAGVDVPASPPASECRPPLLLVEDHPDTAKLMSRVLRGLGYEVTIAQSVAEGLDAVAEHNPVVLISDMGLPDGSGLDLMRQLKERGYSIPAIALSGYGAPSDVEASKAAGFAEHLTKPLTSLDTLAVAISQLGICGGGGEVGAIGDGSSAP